MHTLWFIAVVVVGVGGFGASLAGPPKETADDKELEKFQGKWVWVSLTSDGKDREATVLNDLVMTFDGNAMSVARNGDPIRSATFSIDPSKSPKQIDITDTDGPQKGKATKGIYKFDGDTLTICRVVGDRDRPTGFESKQGQFRILTVLKRAK